MIRLHAKLLLTVAVVAAAALLASLPADARLTGAVWTTLCDGSAVDHNVYDAKEDVYLNAGPTTQSSGAWVPDGDYYFMVTDPPGKALLSTDSIDKRMIRIEDGMVLLPNPVPPYTDHNYCEDLSRPGNYTIQLMPYDDSKNGEYKLWITMVDNYDINDPAAKFGFIPSMSKTDNFRVRRGRAMIFGHKFNDLNGNGVWDQPDEPPLNNWEIQLYKKNKSTWTYVASSFTDSGDGSYVFFVTSAAQYKIVEVLQNGWTQTAPLPVPPGEFMVNVTKSQLNANAQLGPYDFGNWTGPTPPAAALQGVKYYEMDAYGTPGYGVYNPATDPPLGAGWEVTLVAGQFDGGGNFVPDYTVTDLNGVLGPWIEMTDASGVWGKANLRRGYVYQVCETPKPGWTQAGPKDQTLSPNVWAGAFCWYAVIPEQVPPGGDDPNYLRLDFGNLACGRIIVFKFEDYDNDGQFDQGVDRPLAHWYMYLYDAYGRILDWAPTDADGYVEFPVDPEACLPYGSYTVAETHIPDWTCTTCPPGTFYQQVSIDELNPVVLVEFGNHYVPCP